MLTAAAFASGAAGLVNELAWTRELGWVLGSTAHALNLVLAVFFLALGAGAFAFGRAIDRSGAPLSWFVAMEALLASCSVALASQWQGLARIAPEVALGSASTARVLLVHGALVLLAIGLPAFVMGGTLPVLVRAVVSDARTAATWIARLYGANTLGGAVGVALAIFVLLPQLGLFGAGCAAAAMNLLALALGLAAKRRAPAVPRIEQVATANGRAPRSAVALLAFAAAAAGFSGVALEVCWTRALAARLSSTVYSFATVLAVYLACLALGSLALRALERFGAKRGALLPFALALAGLGGIASAWQLGGLAPIDPSEHAASLGGLQLAEALTALSVVALACFFNGLAFPLVCGALHESSGRIGSDVGRAYLANTLGSVLAPLAVGYFAFPQLGLRASLFGASWLAITTGALLASAERTRLAGRGGLALGALVIAAVALTRTAPSELRSWSADSGERLLEYVEGVASGVAVVETQDGNRALKLDRGYRLGDSRTAFAQRRQGALPLLLAGVPERALVMGLGTGTTAGALAALAPRASIDVAEVVPELVRFLPWFDEANLGLRERADARPELRLFQQDARYVVRHARAPFDLVVGDLFVPWRAAEAGMYSREHFRAVAGALAKPRGLFCQWLPLYQLDVEDLKSVVRTASEAFPHVHLVWLYDNASQPVVGLVGAFEPIDLSARPRVVGAEERGLLDSMDLGDPADLAASWIASDAALRAFAEGAAIETLDRPRIEFRAAAARLQGEAELARANLESVLALASTAALSQPDGFEPIAEPELTRLERRRDGVLQLLAALLAEASGEDRVAVARAMREALALRPDWALPRIHLRRLATDALAAGELERARAIAGELEGTPAAADGEYVLALVALRSGDRAGAEAKLRAALALEPEHAPSRELLARLR